MKYTMRLNGRLMTDVSVKISLTHEQVFFLQSVSKKQGLTLSEVVKTFINTDKIDAIGINDDEE